MRLTHTQRRRVSAQRGFSLLESLFAISLLGLLFLGAMDLIIASTRTTVRTQAQIYASSDASNTIRNIIGQLREAQSFVLPISTTSGTAETGWVTPTNTALSQFNTTDSSQPISTALEIAAPPALVPSANGYNAGISTIRVQNVAGNSYWSITPYSNVGTSINTSLIYRGDPDGTPDADPTGNAKTGAGTYLWQYAMPENNSFTVTKDAQGNFVNPTPLCKSVSVASNAVQFVRPAYNNAPAPFQAEIKVVSSYYSPINGEQTSEEGSGANTSQLIGKCVYMRDHSPSAPAPKNAVRSSNNVFQYQ